MVDPSLRERWRAFGERPFPAGPATAAGQDLGLLETEVSGLLAAYFGSGGALEGGDWRRLRGLEGHLTRAAAELDGAPRAYFAELAELAAAVVRALSG